MVASFDKAGGGEETSKYSKRCEGGGDVHLVEMTVSLGLLRHGRVLSCGIPRHIALWLLLSLL